jgi:hypothetical protein
MLESEDDLFSKHVPSPKFRMIQPTEENSHKGAQKYAREPQISDFYP